MNMNLQEMIVTNAEGRIQTTDGKKLTGQCIQSDDVYSFYAIKNVNGPLDALSSDKMPARVRIMMPLGGELNGLYRFPRVGEKVVVMSDGDAHYLMGYLPTAENPFSPEQDAKEKTKVFDEEGQVLRYKKTGGNTSDKAYSEIGFYSETTEWKEKEGSTNTKTDKDSGLPVVDKIKLSSTGDIETKAQNYNEVSAKRIGLFAGYDQEMDERKAKQKKNLKDEKKELDLNAFPCLPQDQAEQDPSFFSGDIQMRAKKRIVLKAEDTIEIIAGNSMIRLDATGISLISRKASISAINAWDSAITVSSRSGLSMFGTKVAINSAFKFSMTDSFGGSLTSLGGVMRISGSDVRLQTLCKAAYVLKGVSASASFVTNVASMSMGIAQEQGARSGDGWLVNGLPSYVSLGADIAGTLVGVNWGFNSTPAISDAAGGLMVMIDFIMTVQNLVALGLDKLILSKKDQKNGGRSGLTLAMAVSEFAMVMALFTKINLTNANWFHASSYLMSAGGTVYQDAMRLSQHVLAEQENRSPTGGVDTMVVSGLWNSFSGQAWWKIVLESMAALAVAGGGVTGGIFGYKHSSSVNEKIRKELEVL